MISGCLKRAATVFIIGIDGITVSRTSVDSSKVQNRPQEGSSAQLDDSFTAFLILSDRLSFRCYPSKHRNFQAVSVVFGQRALPYLPVGGFVPR